MNDRLKKEVNAYKTFTDINEAMNEYYVVTGSRLALPPNLEKEPRLADFYVPSADTKTREVLFIILGMGVVGYMRYELFTKINYNSMVNGGRR